MLTLSFSQPQGCSFRSPNMANSGMAATGSLSQAPLCQMSRRSMVPQNCKRPKLSLQTSILPQPVSPALPLPCSADTPTARNTLANSFRSPATANVEKCDDKLIAESQQKEATPCPYGPESTRRSILKNTPLANLIRSRREERSQRNSKLGAARIAFLDKPQIISRPPQDSEPDFEEEEPAQPCPALSAPEATAPSNATTSCPASSQTTTHTRSDSAEWHRLRTQRSANEGRELRSAKRTSIGSAPPAPASASPAAAPASASPLPACETSPSHPPQTPETPSPLRTRDWVWTLGDSFVSTSPVGADDDNDNDDSRAPPAPQAPATQDCEPRRLKRVPTGFHYPAGVAPDTPSTAATNTPMTPLSSQTAASSVPDTPVTPGSAAGDAGAMGGARGLTLMMMPLSIDVDAPPKPAAVKELATPCSVPLPETPRWDRRL